MWKNIVEPDRQQTTIWRMRITCCITKATNTYLEYLILNAFPRQQWFRKTLHYYVVCTLSVLLSNSGHIKQRTNSSVPNACVYYFIFPPISNICFPLNINPALSDSLLARDINEQKLASALHVWKEVTLIC